MAKERGSFKEVHRPHWFGINCYTNLAVNPISRSLPDGPPSLLYRANSPGPSCDFMLYESGQFRRPVIGVTPHYRRHHNPHFVRWKDVRRCRRSSTTFSGASASHPRWLFPGPGAGPGGGGGNVLHRTHQILGMVDTSSTTAGASCGPWVPTCGTLRTRSGYDPRLRPTRGRYRVIFERRHEFFQRWYRRIPFADWSGAVYPVLFCWYGFFSWPKNQVGR